MILFVFNLAVYYALATIFSGTTARDFKGRILAISLGTILVTMGVAHLLTGWLGVVAGLVVGAAVSFLGLTRWLEMTTRQSLKISGSYAAYLVASAFLIELLFEV